jgi:hypothetical protein
VILLGAGLRFPGLSVLSASGLRCAAFLTAAFLTAAFLRTLDLRAVGRFLRALAGDFDVIGPKCHCRASPGNPSRLQFHNIMAACRRHDDQ